MHLSNEVFCGLLCSRSVYKENETPTTRSSFTATSSPCHHTSLRMTFNFCNTKMHYCCLSMKSARIIDGILKIRLPAHFCARLNRVEYGRVSLKGVESSLHRWECDLAFEVNFAGSNSPALWAAMANCTCIEQRSGLYIIL